MATSELNTTPGIAEGTYVDEAQGASNLNPEEEERMAQWWDLDPVWMVDDAQTC